MIMRMMNHEQNLANVLRDPIEGEAGLVRHNMEVLTDSLTGEKMKIVKIRRRDKPGFLDTVFQLTIRPRKDGGGKNRFGVVGCKIIESVLQFAIYMIYSTCFKFFLPVSDISSSWEV